MSKKLSSSQNRKRTRIILTGGHAGATAYAVIEELKSSKGILWDINFIGAEKAIEGKGIMTLERTTLPRVGVAFHSLFTGRIQRKFSIWTIPSLIKIPFGFIHAFALVARIKPEVTLSFGGYAAFPVVVASWAFGVPVVVHEQTIAVGRANRISSIFAKKVALARVESRAFFPVKKIIVVGNPVSKEVLHIKPKNIMGNPPVIFITGGSRGSVAVNDLIEQILEKLLANYRVIHQTGVYQLAKFNNIKKSLGKKLSRRYEIYGVIKPWNWGRILEGADMVISRAGANVVSEIMVSKRPAILIPLPFAYQDEQRKNALYAQSFGIAQVLEQGSVTPEKLIAQVAKLRRDWDKIVTSVKDKSSPDENSAASLVGVVRGVL